MNRIIVNALTAKLATGFVSTEETRYYLKGFCVQPCKDGATIVATDGHRMGVFHQTDAVVQWAGTAIVALPKEALKACQPAKRDIMAHNWLVIESESQFGKAAALIVQADSIGAVQDARKEPAYVAWQGYVDIVDGSFPDWRRVLPTPDTVTKPVLATFNAKLLKPFIAVSLSSATDSRDKNAKACLTFGGEDPGSPVAVHSTRGDFFGVLMPVRGGGVYYPTWLKNEPQAA